ncbi:DUF6655 family protein [Salinisphaera hydrothermalis]|uniref:DUF6655 family protein n=1 Tax=Salinisphaera hydrothermalis TaxID=563188 RepID=UPI003340092A
MAKSSRILITGTIICASITMAGCTTVRETQPTQTAREQLMLSTAADLASAQIKPNVPKGNSIYVDTSEFTDDSEYRTKYAVARIQSQLLADGYKLVGSADKADTIAEVSNGALSIDQSDTLFGIPSIPIPIPLTGTVKTPELAFYKKARRTGVAKFGVAFYNAKTGDMQDIVGPVYGFSHYDRSSILGISWKHQNLLPQEAQQRMNGKTPSHAASSAD